MSDYFVTVVSPSWGNWENFNFHIEKIRENFGSDTTIISLGNNLFDPTDDQFDITSMGTNQLINKLNLHTQVDLNCIGTQEYRWWKNRDTRIKFFAGNWHNVAHRLPKHKMFVAHGSPLYKGYELCPSRTGYEHIKSKAQLGNIDSHVTVNRHLRKSNQTLLVPIREREDNPATGVNTLNVFDITFKGLSVVLDPLWSTPMYQYRALDPDFLAHRLAREPLFSNQKAFIRMPRPKPASNNICSLTFWYTPERDRNFLAASIVTNGTSNVSRYISPWQI